MQVSNQAIWYLILATRIVHLWKNLVYHVAKLLDHSWKLQLQLPFLHIQFRICSKSHENITHEFVIEQYYFILLRSLIWLNIQMRFLLMEQSVLWRKNHGMKSAILGCFWHGHGLLTPNKGINQRNMKIWADVADKICFGHT